MQPWQIKILELEQSVLKKLAGFIDRHMLLVSIAIICLVIAFGFFLIFHLRRKHGKWGGRPVIFIQTPAPSAPQVESFDPFPPPHHTEDRDCDDDD